MTIEGVEYTLEINNGPNHLHGGSKGFANQLWESRVETNRVVFSRVSPDGEQNYPGELYVEVGYYFGEDNDLEITFAAKSDKTTVVERDGQRVAIEIPVQSVMEFVEQTDFISPRVPFKIAGVVEGLGAAAAGLQVGDVLVSFNGVPTVWFDEYTPLLEASAGQSVTLGYEREGVSGLAEVVVSNEGKIGVGVASAEYIPVRTRSYNLWQAIPRGFERVGEEMSDYWKQLKMIVQPKTEMYKALGGPISIGSIFPNEWNWEYFWRVTALLSVILAIMNVLPIPALDGGHVLFLLVEVVTGRKPSDKVLLVAQMIGMALLFGLMFYATWNDIVRLFDR
jgi:regulator of sigma E protease